MLIKGKVRWALIRGGVPIYRGGGSNLITNSGEALAAEIFDPDGSVAKVDFVGIGSGTTAPTKLDTDLETEHTLVGLRAQSGLSLPSANAVLFAFSIAPTFLGGEVLAEMGLFNNGTVGAGDMFSRFLIQPVTAQIGDTLSLQWTILFGAF